MNAFVTLRPVRPEDEPFLRELRARVDVERLGLRYWAPGTESLELANKIVQSQFNAHAAHYRRVKNERDTKDCVIELNGHPVGRFIVSQNEEEVYLADLAVHPNFRGQGIGQAVIEAIKQECESSKRLLHLHVDLMNTALQFYAAQGFRVIGELATHYLMEWVPPSLLGRTQVFGPARS